MGYLVAAYGVLWAISFGLVFSLLWRQRKLREDLAALKQMIGDEGSDEGHPYHDA